MSAKVPMLDRRFGRLVVVAESGRIRKEVAWRCRCECGKEIISAGFNLRSGNTTSCGCRVDEVRKTLTFKPRHGMSDSRIHRSWISMRRRCEKPADTAYVNYGARGIKVCDRWKLFENFALDMGPMPDGMTLERIDVNGNYEPRNCRWATMAEQSRNTRRTLRMTVDGVERLVSEWAEKSGIGYSTILYRLRKGWNPSDVVRTPVRGKAAHPVGLR